MFARCSLDLSRSLSISLDLCLDVSLDVSLCSLSVLSLCVFSLHRQWFVAPRGHHHQRDFVRTARQPPHAGRLHHLRQHRAILQFETHHEPTSNDGVPGPRRQVSTIVVYFGGGSFWKNDSNKRCSNKRCSNKKFSKKGFPKKVFLKERTTNKKIK